MQRRLYLKWSTITFFLVLGLIGIFFLGGDFDQSSDVSGNESSQLESSQKKSNKMEVVATPQYDGAGPKTAAPTPPTTPSLPQANAVPQAPQVVAQNPPRHAADPLLAASDLVSEKWSDPDAVGNRERVAIYESAVFKYRWLRVVEKWSGKSGLMDSRLVMVANHLLAAPIDGANTDLVKSQITAAGFTLGEQVGESGMIVSFDTKIDDPDELPRRIQALAALTDAIDYAEPDHLVWPCLEPNDPAYLANKLWGLSNRGGVSGYKVGADIDAPAAWAIRNDASNVVVSVTDTGVHYNHEDLVQNMWRNTSETAGDGIDNDANGIVDDVFGYNAVDNNGNPMDDQGHGTHCAGTIGARGDNGIGMTGVAWNVKLMAGRFLGQYGGTTSDGIKVIQYSRLMGADIISASWGGGGYSKALQDAIAACARADIPFVAAAGNSGTNNDSLPHYPSSYNVPNIVSVAATNANDALTDFSCFGRNSVDIAAPGWQIWSSYSTGNSDYRFLQGTSMATPHVSGALALARAHYPEASAQELIEKLYKSADKLGALSGKVATGARLNVHRMLTEIIPKLPNDYFEQAYVLEGSYATWSGGNQSATREMDEHFFSPAPDARTLWFQWQPPHDGFATLTTDSLGAGQRVIVFSGNTRFTLQLVYDSGPMEAGVSQTVCRFYAEADKNYKILTASDSASGELFNLNLELTADNDQVSQALSLTGEAFQISGFNRGATAQPFEIDSPHAGVGAGHSVWYRWVAPFSTTYSVNSEGSDTDTVLAIYNGDPVNPEDFTTVGANDDISAVARWSRVDFTAVAGETYFIAVDTAMGGQPGSFVLRGAMPASPEIVSEPADLDVSVGTRAVLSVGAAGTPPLRYQWFKNNEALPGAWETSLVIDPVSEDSFGEYHVTVSNTFGTTTSRTVQFTEKQIAPSIVWSTGDVTIITGQASSIGVQVVGSAPLTYSWTKDGVPLTGEDEPFLHFTNVTTTTKGIYACTVSNNLGTASSTMVVGVVTSPFESFTAVRASAPNSPIASISVIDGKCYAVASERIMVSTDGKNWTPWYLPSGFDGSALAKHNGKWYCTGYRLDGALSMAISTNGVTWSDPVVITGITPHWSGHLPVSQLVSFNGRLVASITPFANSGTWGAGAVYYSSDGISWTTAKRRKVDTTQVDLSIKCRFEVWGGKLYAPGDDTTSRILVSSDGITWQESNLPVDGSGNSYSYGKMVGAVGNQLCVVCLRGTYFTVDGINWTMSLGISPDNEGYFGRKLVSTGGMAYGFSTWSGLASYRMGTSTTNWINYTVNPTGQNFSAAAEFGGAIICGTTSGLLRRIESQDDFTGTTDAIYPLHQIEYLNNEFLVYRPDAGSPPEAPGPVMISGDGRRWRASKSFSQFADHTEKNPIANLFLGGRYIKGTRAGWVPAAMSSNDVLPSGRSAIAAATDGNRWLVLGSYPTVYSVSMDGLDWTTHQSTGMYSLSTSQLVHFNGKWFLTNNASYDESCYSSVDGITWSKILNVPGATMIVFNNKLYAFNYRGSSVLESSDGNTWQTFATGITAGTTRSGTPNISIKRLLLFDNKMIVVINEATSFRMFAFFTQDARTWFRASIPTNLKDLVVGNQMLAGVTSNGGILVSASTAASGSAPLVDITYPPHKSTHVSGRLVEITGNSNDPEGQSMTTECRVDGVIIGTSAEKNFRFLFRATNPDGHVISIRTRDSGGLIGSNEIKVFASPPELKNDLESEEGKSYLPQVAWASFGGRTYAAGAYSLYRTRDDGTWESVLLPSLPASITNLVAGNGTLIVQTSSANFATRDGVVWTQFTSPIGGTIVFRDGWFTASFYNSYYSFTQTGFSQDGLVWKLGLGSNSSNSWSPSLPTVTPNGSLLVTPPHRSTDGGLNWIAMPEFGSATANTLQFATAYGAVFAGLSDGRVMRSDNDGRTWQLVAQFAALPVGHQARIALHAGRLFWGGGGFWLASSPDGITWSTLAAQTLQSTPLQFIDGRYVGFGRSGMVWSSDGSAWESAIAGPSNPSRNMLAEDGDALLVGDTNGGVWRSQDGRTWIQVMSGKPMPPPPSHNYDLALTTRIQIGDVTVVGGSPSGHASNTFLWYTENAGLDWKTSNFHGGLFSLVTISKLWSNGTTAFAATSQIIAEGYSRPGLWRSTNGRDWHQVWSWPGGTILEMEFHGSEWMCLGTNGEVRRTLDQGETWSADLRPVGLLAGRAFHRFDDAWIVMGTEAANLSGPNVIHVSTDGQTWTKHTAPGGETVNSYLSSAATQDALVVYSHNTGKIYTATDRNLTWVHTGTTNIIYVSTKQLEVVGNRFCILNRLVSSDGITWTVPTRIGSSTIAVPTIYFKGTYVTFLGFSPSYWSTDGLNWTQNTGGLSPGSRPVLAMDSDVLRVRYPSGAIWETSDGRAWSQVRDGAPDLVNAGHARRIISHGDLLVVTGTEGLLQYSEDDGRSWQMGLVNGQRLSKVLNEREIKSSPHEILANFHFNSDTVPPVCRHYRSTDGRTWSELPNMTTLNVMDYAWANGEWLALCHNGSLLRSTDGGINWSNAGSIPNVVRGLRLTRFEGRWVAAGTQTSTEAYHPIQLYSSLDGVTWTHCGFGGSYDLFNRTTPPLFFTGHGVLYFGRQPSINNTAQGPVMTSTDGLTWTAFNKTGNTRHSSGTTAAMFLPIADGYLALASTGVTTNLSYYWKSPVSGGAWTASPLLQNQIRWMGTPDGQRLFLFGAGIIKEWTTEDLELTTMDPEVNEIGVGDTLTVATSLRNLGTNEMTHPITVNAWLSSDRFFGDGNDVYVGWDTWSGAAPNPGEVITQNLSFTLPNTIRPGDQYLIVELSIPDTYRESNRANNVSISSKIAVTIPQRRLEVLANGNGSVSADQNAEYYPHGARIAIVANAGKGARFAGWGGDALGSLGETLIIMNSDKSVQANFVSTTALTVFTRGGGTVTQSSDDGIYLSGTTAELTATPLPGWTFSGWSGGITGNVTTSSVLMNTNKIVTARFTLGFDAWKNQKFSVEERANSAISGDSADPDGDGLQNWREWLRGSNPKNRLDRGQGELRREGNWMVLSYTRMETMPTGHSVRLRASSNLNDWNLPVEERIIGSANGIETIEARIQTTGKPSAFFRIEDSRSSP